MEPRWKKSTRDRFVLGSWLETCFHVEVHVSKKSFRRLRMRSMRFAEEASRNRSKAKREKQRPDGAVGTASAHKSDLVAEQTASFLPKTANKAVQVTTRPCFSYATLPITITAITLDRAITVVLAVLIAGLVPCTYGKLPRLKRNNPNRRALPPRRRPKIKRLAQL